jgi:hypothetical protein
MARMTQESMKTKQMMRMMRPRRTTGLSPVAAWLILVLTLWFGTPSAFAEPDRKIDPKSLIQHFHVWLYEQFKPDFLFSEQDPVSTSAAAAHVLLDSHRDEFRGQELSSPMIRRSIDRVRKAQLPDGSFGKENAPREERLAATVAAVLALRATANPDYEKAISGATNWLELQEDRQLDPARQFLKFLALSGEDKIDATEADRLLRLASAMRVDADSEVASLGFLCSALLRSACELGRIPEEKARDLPNWQFLAEQAGALLLSFLEAKNVRGACIAARALHYCLVANERKKKH